MVEALTHWAYQYAPAGDIGKFEDQDIEEGLGWEGETGGAVAALVEARFVEPHETHRLVIHDWRDHADDATHMKLARSGELIWCGTLPKLSRLSKSERDAIIAIFKAKNGVTHNKRTACVSKTHNKRTALPSPPLPPPPIPSPPLDTPQPPEGGESAFDRFWEAYPRRIGKDAALRAWSKAVKRTDPEEIVAAAVEFAASPAAEDLEFVKHPGTWLNAGCWLDDRAEWQRRKGSKPRAATNGAAYTRDAESDSADYWAQRRKENAGG